ncbi:MAG: hypothetical protein ABIT20_13305 [Gemmatimonadaceae bacterium]
MRRTAQLLAAIALLGACRDEQLPTRIQPLTSPGHTSAETHNGELATLIRVTTPFLRFETAKRAGWSAQITPCMASPEGGMGFHYGNTALIDGSARVEEPELLLYEPDHTGRLHLVAVEYIVPYTAHSRSAAPPVLFGQQFKQNDTFQLWGLHVWIWKANTRGLFAPWNPQVACGLAGGMTAMSH